MTSLLVDLAHWVSTLSVPIFIIGLQKTFFLLLRKRKLENGDKNWNICDICIIKTLCKSKVSGLHYIVVKALNNVWVYSQLWNKNNIYLTCLSWIENEKMYVKKHLVNCKSSSNVSFYLFRSIDVNYVQFGLHIKLFCVNVLNYSLFTQYKFINLIAFKCVF